MKKLGAFLAGVGLLASATFAADSNTATSVNIVGFQKITCPRGQLVMVSTAFKSLDGAPLKSANVFSNQLPEGSFVYAWSAVSNKYLIDDIDLEGWRENITYEGKMGFWIRVPATADSNSYDVVMSGEVPMNEYVTNNIYPGLNMFGFPYTASVLWTNTSLAKNAQGGDWLYIWTGSGYNSYTMDLEGWGDANSVIINPGTAFWFRSISGSVSTYIENRPYNP